MRCAIESREFIRIGWNIPLEVREKFTDFVKQVGGVVQEDCAGALLLWGRMPSQIRERLKVEAKGLLSDDELKELDLFFEQFRSGWGLASRALQDNPKQSKDEQEHT